jgi:hypothetical protein
MMQTGPESAIAAVFADPHGAQAAVAALEAEGFSSPWMAVTKPANGDETLAEFGSNQTYAQHDVAGSNDGVLGAIGRFLSGESSLRRSLVDHGIPEADATAVDDAMPAGGAVVVVSAGARTDAATAVFTRNGARVYGAQYDPRHDVRNTVAGQGDELDRGTGRIARAAVSDTFHERTAG